MNHLHFYYLFSIFYLLYLIWQADWRILLIWIPAIFGTITQNIKKSSCLWCESLTETWSGTKHVKGLQLEQIWLHQSGFGNKTSSQICPFVCSAHGRSYASEGYLLGPWPNTDCANANLDFWGRKLRRWKQEMIHLMETKSCKCVHSSPFRHKKASVGGFISDPESLCLYENKQRF